MLSYMAIQRFINIINMSSESRKVLLLLLYNHKKMRYDTTFVNKKIYT